MILEIEIPVDKEDRFRNAFEDIYNETMTKTKVEAIIKEWIVNKVRIFENEQAIELIVIEDLY